ncbi:surface polysaccharide O-acyltransferase-like enzyme [Kribbella amoyensis]|uniref:Surface polysaccharide O-acyltransferase-like enzyme n=1 Tax=Kribbella amoyensis TaxID=996641 RepID=A0A561BUL5_9ACTN|nr:acyltransferase [Kribbella amoyensis]TWD82483.1 surface polysaccharide O-acyltransferase-like enzyme [Kribbella amoyensis]
MWTVNNPVGQRPARGRLHFLDHLKVALVVLVVLHHAAQPFGPPDWWYVTGTDRWEPLGRFTVVNGAFFMSLFFAISAYLLPASFDRKGGPRYLLDRFRRLGAPLLFGVAVIIPALMYAHYRVFRDYPSISFGRYYTDVYLGLAPEPAGWTGPSWPDLQFGHLWFIEHLLVYAILYAVWRAVVRRRPRPSTVESPRTAAIIGFTAVLGLGTYAIRITWPVDTWVGILDFLQAEPADLVQYGGFFLAGLLAYRRGWFTGLSSRAGYTWLAVGVTLAIAHYAALPQLARYYAPGGTGIRSLVWSVVETTMCTALSLGLLTLFRERLNQPNRFLQRLAAASFTVYVLHVPVVVALQLATRELSAPPLLKFLLVGFIAVPLSFTLATGLRRVRYLRAWI